MSTENESVEGMKMKTAGEGGFLKKLLKKEDRSLSTPMRMATIHSTDQGPSSLRVGAQHGAATSDTLRTHFGHTTGNSVLRD